MQAQNAIAEMHNSTTMEVSFINLVFFASLEYFGNNWTADLVSVLNCINWCDLTEVSWDAHFKRLLVFDSTKFISIMKHF